MVGADSSVAEWHEAGIKQIAEDQFAAQPLERLCHDCGEAVDILSLAEDLPKEDVIQKAIDDRVCKARVLLMQHLKAVAVPRGFECSMVCTTHTLGQQTNAACIAVNTHHFIAHPNIAMDPSSLSAGKLEQKPFPILNSEVAVDTCVAIHTTTT